MEEAFKDINVRDHALKVVETENYDEATVTRNVTNYKNYTVSCQVAQGRETWFKVWELHLWKAGQGWYPLPAYGRILSSHMLGMDRPGLELCLLVDHCPLASPKTLKPLLQDRDYDEICPSNVKPRR